MVRTPNSMLPPNNIKAEISHAYLHAVAAKMGFMCDRPPTDFDSCDVEIKSRGKISSDSVKKSVSLAVQLKATCSIVPKGNTFSFDLPIKNFNDLRDRDRATNAILVVLLLPENESEWLVHDYDGLITRHCAYWHSLIDEPESENTSSQVVHIHTKNVFSPDSLYDLMNTISKEEEIHNV